MGGGLCDEKKAWRILNAPNDAVEQVLRKNESLGAGTRRRLNLPEIVADTDMFNLKE
jgi:hypothetical protein